VHRERFFLSLAQHGPAAVRVGIHMDGDGFHLPVETQTGARGRGVVCLSRRGRCWMPLPRKHLHRLEGCGRGRSARRGRLLGRLTAVRLGAMQILCGSPPEALLPRRPSGPPPQGTYPHAR
jgi:hypothetical protein